MEYLMMIKFEDFFRKIQFPKYTIARMIVIRGIWEPKLWSFRYPNKLILWHF